MADVTAFQAAAPFLVAACLNAMGIRLSSMVEDKTEATYKGQLHDMKVDEARVPVSVSPPELRNLAAWAIDTAQSLTSVAAPATALLLMFKHSSSGLIVAYSVVLVGTVWLVTRVYLDGPVGYPKKTWYGFSLVTLYGLVGNVIAAALAVAVVSLGAV